MKRSRKYFSDDARMKAVEETLDTSKPWGKQKEGDIERAVDRYYAICANWYIDHKERADSKEGRDSTTKQLKDAFRHLRTVTKNQKKVKKEITGKVKE